jgi:pimeloyl-ACP methyl ester carboxylesterase
MHLSPQDQTVAVDLRGHGASGGRLIFAVLGVLVVGAVHTVIRHVPVERQAETAAMLVGLLEERLETHGLPSNER